jgi:hypothetical protein
MSKGMNIGDNNASVIARFAVSSNYGGCNVVWPFQRIGFAVGPTSIPPHPEAVGLSETPKNQQPPRLILCFPP